MNEQGIVYIVGAGPGDPGLITVRGLECLPPEISGLRNYENFDHIVVESDFEQRDCQKRLMEIARQIYLRYVALSNAGVFDATDCQQFRFPDKVAIQGWLLQVSQIRTFSMPGH